MKHDQVDIEETDEHKIKMLENIIMTLKGTQKQIIPNDIASNIVFEMEVFNENESDDDFMKDSFTFLVVIILNKRILNEVPLTLEQMEKLLIKNEVRKKARVVVKNQRPLKLDPQLFSLMVNLVDVTARYVINKNRVSLEIWNEENKLFVVDEREIVRYLKIMEHPTAVLMETFEALPGIISIVSKRVLDDNYVKELEKIAAKILVDRKKYAQLVNKED